MPGVVFPGYVLPGSSIAECFMKNKVTVVIPTLNAAKTLERCLASIARNKTIYEYDVVVVDAGSTDATADVVSKQGAKIIIDKGCPIGKGRNIGVRNATGDIICFTDSDCVVPENWIEGLVENLIQLNTMDSKVVGVGGGNIPLLEDPSFMQFVIARVIRSPLVAFGARNVTVYKQKCEILHNPPVNSAYFRSAIEEAGGFGEKNGYPEDLELDAKIYEAGYKLYYLTSPLVQHAHRTSFKHFVEQMYDFGRKRSRINRTHQEFLRKYDSWGKKGLTSRGGKRFMQIYHLGPVFLCLMTFTPLIIIPLSMALINAFLLSFKAKDPRIFFPAVALSMSFYVSYGAGQIGEMLRYRKGRESESVPA